MGAMPFGPQPCAFRRSGAACRDLCMVAASTPCFVKLSLLPKMCLCQSVHLHRLVLLCSSTTSFKAALSVLDHWPTTILSWPWT
eukprot:352454-Chlamydomonas_euryale.AAC.11